MQINLELTYHGSMAMVFEKGGDRSEDGKRRRELPTTAFPEHARASRLAVRQ